MLYIGAALPVRRWLVPALGLCWFAVIFRQLRMAV